MGTRDHYYARYSSSLFRPYPAIAVAVNLKTISVRFDGIGITLPRELLHLTPIIRTFFFSLSTRSRAIDFSYSAKKIRKPRRDILRSSSKVE